MWEEDIRVTERYAFNGRDCDTKLFRVRAHSDAYRGLDSNSDLAEATCSMAR